MSRFFKGLGGFLPHLIIAMSITLLTLSVTDHFNTAMAFINHSMTKWLIAVYCLISLAVCLILFVRTMGDLTKAVLPLICTLVTVAMLMTLIYDKVYPREVLLTKDFGKTLIFVNTVVSLACAAYAVAFNRRNIRPKTRKRKSGDSGKHR